METCVQIRVWTQPLTSHVIRAVTLQLLSMFSCEEGPVTELAQGPEGWRVGRASLDGASTCWRVWMTRGRRPGVGTAACGWSQCEVALSQTARGSRHLLPCSLPREALPGHRRGHLLARQRVPPQPHSPEELSPSASCQDLAAGLPACPARHRGPGHSESGLTAQDVGWPLGGSEHSTHGRAG